MEKVEQKEQEKMRVKFGSLREFHDFANNHPECWDSVSPSTAAGELGVTRDRIYQLIDEGKVRGWFVYEKGNEYHDVPRNRASYIYVSWPDLLAYKAAPRGKGGRPKKHKNID